MKKRETKAWDAFSAHIDPAKLKCERIETNIERFPDVIAQNRNGAVILIENKALAQWPKRESTLPLRNAFEPGQLTYLRNWCQWGGNAYVLLHVGERRERSTFLLDPHSPLNEMTMIELLENSLVVNFTDIIPFLERHKK